MYRPHQTGKRTVYKSVVYFRDQLQGAAKWVPICCLPKITLTLLYQVNFKSVEFLKKCWILICFDSNKHFLASLSRSEKVLVEKWKIKHKFYLVTWFLKGVDCLKYVEQLQFFIYTVKSWIKYLKLPVVLTVGVKPWS